MTTSMHRLQISLPEEQFQYLAERARREGLSMAEIIRRLIEREARSSEYRSATKGIPIAESPLPYTSVTGQSPVTLALALPAELHSRLRWEAQRAGTALLPLIQNWLTERVRSEPLMPETERELVLQVLSEAGFLTELGPELSALADSTISLEEVQATLDRAGGKPLSEIILEQRGSKS